VICPACAAENRAGAKFCSECGTPLAQPCSSCGSPYAVGQRFCDECGAAPLLEQAATTFQELHAAPALDRVLRLRDEQPQDAISA
jgi:hypothetical protein